MKKYKNRISYIVPTMDRVDDLANLFESLVNQTKLPDEVIVVVGGCRRKQANGERPGKNRNRRRQTSEERLGGHQQNTQRKHFENNEELIKHYEQFIQIEYKNFEVPGLAKQRNIGILMTDPSAKLIGFLDDDIVLENDATERMLDFWESAGDEVGGASFNIINNPEAVVNWYTKLFSINDGNQGTIMRSGFSVVVNPVIKDTQVEWLCGGATVWKRDVTEEYRFDEALMGFGYFDDTDYSLQVNKKYKLFVLEASRVKHFPPERGRTDGFRLEKYNTINRYGLVRKYESLSTGLFLWSTFGRIVLYFGLFIIKIDYSKLLRSIGIVFGLMEIPFTKQRTFNKAGPAVLGKEKSLKSKS